MLSLSFNEIDFNIFNFRPRVADIGFPVLPFDSGISSDGSGIRKNDEDITAGEEELEQEIKAVAWPSSIDDILIPNGTDELSTLAIKSYYSGRHTLSEQNNVFAYIAPKFFSNTNATNTITSALKYIAYGTPEFILLAPYPIGYGRIGLNGFNSIYMAQNEYKPSLTKAYSQSHEPLTYTKLPEVYNIKFVRAREYATAYSRLSESHDSDYKVSSVLADVNFAELRAYLYTETTKPNQLYANPITAQIQIPERFLQLPVITDHASIQQSAQNGYLTDTKAFNDLITAPHFAGFSPLEASVNLLGYDPEIRGVKRELPYIDNDRKTKEYTFNHRNLSLEDIHTMTDGLVADLPFIYRIQEPKIHENNAAAADKEYQTISLSELLRELYEAGKKQSRSSPEAKYQIRKQVYHTENILGIIKRENIEVLEISSIVGENIVGVALQSYIEEESSSTVQILDAIKFFLKDTDIEKAKKCIEKIDSWKIDFDGNTIKGLESLVQDLRNFGYEKVNIYVHDVIGGHQFSDGEKETVPTPSINKLPLAWVLEYCAQEGLIDTTKPITIEEDLVLAREKNGYDGIFKNAGSTVGYDTLRKLSIEESVNSATNHILKLLGGEGGYKRGIKIFKNVMKKLGFGSIEINSLYHGLCDYHSNQATMEDLSKFAYFMANSGVLKEERLKRISEHLKNEKWSMGYTKAGILKDYDVWIKPTVTEKGYGMLVYAEGIFISLMANESKKAIYTPPKNDTDLNNKGTQFGIDTVNLVGQLFTIFGDYLSSNKSKKELSSITSQEMQQQKEMK